MLVIPPRISRRHITFMLLLSLQFVLTACGTTPADSTGSRMFTIGELSNIMGGNVRAAEGAPITTRQGSLHAALTEMGYVEGKDVTFVFDTMVDAPPPAPTTEPGTTPVAPAPPTGPLANDPARLSTVAQQMVEQKVDLIIAYGTAASLEAQKAVAGTSIPVVFVGATDPLQIGLVKSLQNTEGNITGIGATSDAYAKQLEWLLRINPDTKRVLVPMTTLTDPVGSLALKAIQEYAAKTGVEVVLMELPTTEEATKALENLPDVDAIMLTTASPFNFIQAGIPLKLPVSYAFPNLMTLGPLLSFNLTEAATGTAAARYVDRILRGAKPADLPVEVATNSLAINLQTANAIGVTISDEILQQAPIIIR